MNKEELEKLANSFKTYTRIEKKSKRMDILWAFRDSYQKGLTKSLSSKSKINLDREYYNELKEILIKNKFVFDIKNKNLFEKSEAFLEASLETDFVRTLKVIPSIIDKNKKQIVLNYFKRNNITFSLLPQELIKDKELGISDPQELDFMRTNVESLIAYYHPNFENKILEMLDSKCKTIEEYIISIKDSKKEELTVNQMYALGFYLRKLLTKEHLSLYKINLFDYTDSSLLGSQHHGADSNQISIYNGNLGVDVARIIHTVHHEFIHALQDKQIKDNLIEVDGDLDFYLEDKLLMKSLSVNYKVRNYSRLSYEFDADYKAYLLDKTLFSEDENRKDTYDKLKERYENNFNRSTSKAFSTLDNVFLKYLNEDSKVGNLLKREIKDKKLLTCKFVFDVQKEKYVLKDLDKLKDDYLNTTDELEKKIYYNLIKRNTVGKQKDKYKSREKAYLDLTKYKMFLDVLKKR